MGGYFRIRIQIWNPHVHTFQELCSYMIISNHILRYGGVPEHQNGPPTCMSRRRYIINRNIRYLWEMVCELIYTILLYFFAGWMPLKTEHMVYVICIGCIIYIADGDHYIIKQICYTCVAHTSGCGKHGWLMAFELAYKSARCTYSAHNKPAKLWGLIVRLCYTTTAKYNHKVNFETKVESRQFNFFPADPR